MNAVYCRLDRDDAIDYLFSSSYQYRRSIHIKWSLARRQMIYSSNYRLILYLFQMPFDIFLSTSFGFTAESVNVTKSIKKFVVAEVYGSYPVRYTIDYCIYRSIVIQQQRSISLWEISSSISVVFPFTMMERLSSCSIWPSRREALRLCVAVYRLIHFRVGEIDVLIERPVSVKNREATAALIKAHLVWEDDDETRFELWSIYF